MGLSVCALNVHVCSVYANVSNEIEMYIIRERQSMV